MKFPRFAFHYICLSETCPLVETNLEEGRLLVNGHCVLLGIVKTGCRNNLYAVNTREFYVSSTRIAAINSARLLIDIWLRSSRHSKAFQRHCTLQHLAGAARFRSSRTAALPPSTRSDRARCSALRSDLRGRALIWRRRHGLGLWPNLPSRPHSPSSKRRSILTASALELYPPHTTSARYHGTLPAPSLQLVPQTRRCESGIPRRRMSRTRQSYGRPVRQLLLR